MAHGATIASLENIIEGPVVHQMISAVPGRAGSRTQSVGLSGDTSTKGIASDCSHSSHYYIPAITRTQKERDSAHTQKEKDRCEVSKRQNKIIPNCKTLLWNWCCQRQHLLVARLGGIQPSAAVFPDQRLQQIPPDQSLSIHDTQNLPFLQMVPCNDAKTNKPSLTLRYMMQESADLQLKSW